MKLEGVVKIGNEFLRTLSKRSDFAKILNIPLSFASKGKLPKKALGSAAMRAIIERNATESSQQTNQKPTLQEFINHLQKKGRKNIKNIGQQILNDLNIHKNINPIIAVVTDDYVTMMQNYYDFVNADKTDTIIDRDFVYLDIVETSSQLLYSEERKLLHDIIMGQNLTDLNNNVQKVNEKIFKNSVQEKKEKLQYLCDIYHVCREFPAFTDYCADVISEALKLSDKKFSKFIEIITKIIKQNYKFFATVSEKEDRELIIDKLQSLSKDFFDMKEFFAVLRAVINQRFKAISNANENLKIRTKAVRILLDIIDKAFSTEEDLVAIDFDNSVSAMRNWAIGVRVGIDDIYEDFAKSLLRILEFNLTKNARKEISILIKTIMRGGTESDKIYQDLIKFGSKYVRGDDFHPFIDTLNT